jgi:hypothetical protein
MEDLEGTILSQYANSPRIIRLVQNFNEYVDQTANFDAFYNLVWNVDTAEGWGLDVWGRIVNVSRYLQINSPVLNFGFDDGVNDYAPFGQAPFYDGPPATSTYRLADDAYRVLILAKALSNISATTARSINQLLQNLFPDRGRCYVNDLGGMQMRYTFEFFLEPFEIAIVTSSGVLPHGAGVYVNVFQADLPVFGFAEMGTADAAPFDQAPFYTPI